MLADSPSRWPENKAHENVARLTKVGDNRISKHMVKILQLTIAKQGAPYIIEHSMEVSMELRGAPWGSPRRSVEVRGGLYGGPWRSVEVSMEVRGGPWRSPWRSVEAP